MWETAIKMLLADRGKLLTALVGVVFSVVLVNVQGGLFIGLINKASLLVDHSGADIWVGHREMNNVDFPHDIPRRWVHRIRAIDGVERAEAYVVGHSVMTLPSGAFEHVLVVGSDASSLLGGASSLKEGSPERIREPDAIFVDAGDLDKLERPQIGDVREIGRRRAKIAGYTEGILGFLVTPYVFTTADRALEYLQQPPDRASYFLVEVSESANVSQIRRLIESRLPEAETMTGDEYAWASIAYWLGRTGIGISFGAATALGVIVGLIVVAQTLYAAVLDRVHEYATLKAIGATQRQIRSVVMSQALLLALLGSSAGLATVVIVQSAWSSPRAPICIPWMVSLGSCVLVTAICLLASLAPYARLRRVDPALVLQ